MDPWHVVKCCTNSLQIKRRVGTERAQAGKAFRLAKALTIHSPNAALKFAEGGRKNARQRVGSPAGDEQAEGEQELRKSVLHTIVCKVEAVGKMDQENRTGHHDHDAESTEADEGAGEQSESSRKLRKTYQEADHYRGVNQARKAMNAGAPKGAKEYGAAVVEKDDCAGEAEDEQGEIKIAGRSRRGRC